MSKDIIAEISREGTVTVEFAAGPLIMFWALQRIQDSKVVKQWSGDNRDAEPDTAGVDPVSLQGRETFPFSMAVLAPSSEVKYGALVRVIQHGKTVAEGVFEGKLDANKAVNCAGTISFRGVP